MKTNSAFIHHITRVAVQYGCISAKYTAISQGYKCDITFIQQFDGTRETIHKAHETRYMILGSQE